MSNETNLRFGRKKEKKISRDLDTTLGKLPPQAIDMEEAVLGTLMLEKGHTDSIITILKPHHFYLDKHKEIYTTIVELYQERSPIDIRTVAAHSAKMGRLDIIGGRYYLAELTSKVSSSAEIDYHARVVKDMAIKRHAIEMAMTVMNAAYEDDTSPTDLVEMIAKGQNEMLDDLKTFKETHISVRVLELGAEALNRTEAKKEVDGVPSGYPVLDVILRGWRPKLLILIACRPSMGKTTLALNFVHNAAVHFKIPTSFHSMEMPMEEVADKLVSMNTDIPTRRLTHEVLTNDESHRFIDKTRALVAAGIWIDDTPGVRPMELRANARRMIIQHKIGLIVIDYIQLMRGNEKRYDKREEEVASISRELKQIAMELNIPIIALGQLSRAVETRGGDKKPMLSDLRESGSLEQDADIVIMPWRPSYYNITGDANGTFLQGVTQLLIRKHRGGPLVGPQGDPAVAMDPATSKFRSIDSPYVDAYQKAVTKAKESFIKELPFTDFSEPEQKEEPLTTDDLPF